MTRREIVLEAERLGFTTSRTARGHLRFRHEPTGATVITSGTPSDWRSWINCKAQLRRSLRERGVDVEERPLPPRQPCPRRPKAPKSAPALVTLSAKLRAMAAQAECLGPDGVRLARELRDLGRELDTRPNRRPLP
jgi:hypothetical protein